MLRFVRGLLVVLLACSVARADGIQITVGNFDPAPTNTLGGGDFQTIVEAAAATWEDILPLTYDLDITIGWTHVASGPGNVGGFHSSLQRDGQGRTTRSRILFDDHGWFLDPTPALGRCGALNHRNVVAKHRSVPNLLQAHVQL